MSTAIKTHQFLRESEINAHQSLQVRSNNSIRVAVRSGDRRVTKTLKGDLSEDHLKQALKLRDQIRESLSRGHHGIPDDKWRPVSAAMDEAFRTARKRKDYQLSKEDERVLKRRCNGKCELTGLAFDIGKGSWSRRPYAPSIDRIDSSKGYTTDNCRVVCVAINLAMNEWGEDVYKAVAMAYLTHQ